MCVCFSYCISLFSHEIDIKYSIESFMEKNDFSFYSINTLWKEQIGRIYFVFLRLFSFPPSLFFFRI